MPWFSLTRITTCWRGLGIRSGGSGSHYAVSYRLVNSPGGHVCTPIRCGSAHRQGEKLPLYASVCSEDHLHESLGSTTSAWTSLLPMFWVKCVTGSRQTTSPARL